ncbi:MAG: gliding motility lipoprotein GldH [Bacteroidota bacterium]
MKLSSNPILCFHRTFLFFLVVIFSLTLSSCDENRLYEENVNFDQKAWAADSLPVFRFQVDDSAQPYNIYWNVRNTVSYPFRNLYLTYYLEDTMGNVIQEDLYQMDLFEPRTGKPYGSGLGDIFSHQILALPGYQFDTAGMYQIRLQQYMRRDTLPEILSVGVRVEVAGDN